MDHNGLILGAVAKRRVDGIPHPCGHRAADLEVSGSNGLTLFIVGQGYFIHSLPHIRQVADNGQYRHQFGTGGDGESRFHRDTVFAPAVANGNISQCLGAEIHDPVEFDTVRVDIQPPHVCQSLKVFVIVITFVLHSGSQSDHRQIVCVHNIIHVAGQAHGEFGHWN